MNLVGPLSPHEGDIIMRHELKKATGLYTYVASTKFPGSDSSAPDLIKVGQSTNPRARVREIARKCPPDIKLTMTITPFMDAWAHFLLKDDRRLEEAWQLNLPHSSEWFRGGAEVRLAREAQRLQLQGYAIAIERMDWDTGNLVPLTSALSASMLPLT